MDASLIVDLWNTFRDSIEKKNLEATAERFIDTCADYGADDAQLRDAMGSCDVLDNAINYYLDIDTDSDDDQYDDWED